VNISSIFVEPKATRLRQKTTTMKTFRNTNWTRRDYEGTNVIFCQAEEAPKAYWVECDEVEIGKCQQLWIQDGVRYFGYL
jgi:hypothetical protein